MHHSPEGAQTRWLRVYWRPYYWVRRVYWWGVHGARHVTLAFRERLSSVAHRLLDRTDPLSQYQHRREQFLQFYEQYELLVDLLCWAARDTVHDGCDQRYQRVRQWMRANYPIIRHALLPFTRELLRERREDLRGDLFEPLFAPPHVMQVIEQDSGDLLERIILTREVLSRYDAHLRMQIDRYSGRTLR